MITACLGCRITTRMAKPGNWANRHRVSCGAGIVILAPTLTATQAPRGIVEAWTLHHGPATRPTLTEPTRQERRARGRTLRAQLARLRARHGENDVIIPWSSQPARITPESIRRAALGLPSTP